MLVEIDKNLARKLTDFLIWEFRPYLIKNSAENYNDAFSSAETIHILNIILSTAFKNEVETGFFYAQISRIELSRRIWGTLKPENVRRRLILLARYWFISIDSSRRKVTANGKLIRETQLIYPNPLLKEIFEPRKSKPKKDFIKNAILIGDNRESGMQGNFLTNQYGFPESAEYKIEDLNFGEHLIEFSEKRRDQEKEKREENKKWREYNDAFVQCAANLWQAARAKIGHGTEIAEWSGENAKLGSAQRDQRKNLTSIFQSRGGYVAALSWYIYVMGTPEKNQKGKLVFDMKIPHRQFKGSGYTPKTFANHINSVIADPDFKYLSQEGWNDFKNRLTNYFSEELLEVGPEDGTAYSAKLGYVFGQKPLPKLENQSQ